jgi:hypothetical protein
MYGTMPMRLKRLPLPACQERLDKDKGKIPGVAGAEMAVVPGIIQGTDQGPEATPSLWSTRV